MSLDAPLSAMPMIDTKCDAAFRVGKLRPCRRVKLKKWLCRPVGLRGPSLYFYWGLSIIMFKGNALPILVQIRPLEQNPIELSDSTV